MEMEKNVVKIRKEAKTSALSFARCFSGPGVPKQ
jgi:hypothetical protein